MRSGSGSAKRSANHIEAAAISPSSGSENASGKRSASIAAVHATRVIAMPRSATTGNCASKGWSFRSEERRVGKEGQYGYIAVGDVEFTKNKDMQERRSNSGEHI